MIKDIHNILRKTIDLDINKEILPEHMIMADLGADSLNVVEIVMELETEFEIEIDDADIEEDISVDNLHKLVQNLV